MLQVLIFLLAASIWEKSRRWSSCLGCSIESVHGGDWMLYGGLVHKESWDD